MLNKIWLFVFVVLVLIGVAFYSKPTFTPLKVGTSQWVGYQPLYVAQDMGFLAQNNIKIMELSSSSQVVKAMEQGLINAAALTLDEAIILASRNDQYSIILVIDYSFGGDAIITHKHINDFGELVDEKIGLEAGTVSHLLLYRAALAAGISLQDLTILPIHFNEHEQYFSSGEVSAVVTYEPVRTRLLSKGANEIFSSRDIPGEIIDVLVVNRTIEVTLKEQLNVLLEGWFKATKLIKENDQGTLSLLAKRTGTSEAEILNMYQNIHIPDRQEVIDMLYLDQPSLVDQIQLVSLILKELGIETIHVNLLPEEPHIVN